MLWMAMMMTTPVQALTAYYAEVKAEQGIIMRRGPGEKYENALSEPVPEGANLLITDTTEEGSHEWGQTQYNGVPGYVLLDSSIEKQEEVDMQKLLGEVDSNGNLKNKEPEKTEEAATESSTEGTTEDAAAEDGAQTDENGNPVDPEAAEGEGTPADGETPADAAEGESGEEFIAAEGATEGLTESLEEPLPSDGGNSGGGMMQSAIGGIIGGIFGGAIAGFLCIMTLKKMEKRLEMTPEERQAVAEAEAAKKAKAKANAAKKKLDKQKAAAAKKAAAAAKKAAKKKAKEDKLKKAAEGADPDPSDDADSDF